MGSLFENFTLALHKLCKFIKKIKAQSLKNSMSFKKWHARNLPSICKGPQSFAHCVELKMRRGRGGNSKMI
jgi:hypothetical protein